ncbi:MAG: hypothetical protein GY731_03610, partial [Gammaproteobacteria bacterium]|nr:hypothetical protein [Gammaproteobacteria bacterium]
NINATGDYPGITGLAGQLRLRGTQGIMEFHDRTVEVDLPTLFVNTLRTDTLKGAITWQRKKEGWNIATDLLTLANPDIRLQLSGEMHLPDSGDSPSLFLVGKYHDGDGEALATYLPQHIMTKDVVDWLKISIINGRVDSGGLLVHGALADFPFDHGTGRFEIRSNLSNVILDFAPGWPRIEEIEAELLFHGRSLAIHATEGKILGSNIRQTHASIADLEADETLLRIQGTAHGPGGDGIRILTETPLKENFRHYLPQTSINGEIQVAMNIDIPFYDAPSRTKGSITFDRNHILSSSLNLDLEKVTGLLNFTDESMTATGLSGELQKMPVSLAVETTTQAEEPLTRVQVSGQITPEYLIQRLFHSSGSTSKKKVPEFFSRFQGEATWRATLDLPDSATAEVSPPSLAVESELKGLSLDLPEPFGKSAAETGFLRIATTLTTDRQQVIEIEYGANFRGILSLLARKGGFHFDRGAIYLGSASGALPDEQGLQVFGELSEFSTTAWLDLLYQPSNPDKTIPPPPPASPAKSKGHLKRITIKAKQFEVMGQWTADMELQAA